VMHRIWADGSEFRWTREEATAWSISNSADPPKRRDDVLRGRGRGDCAATSGPAARA